MRRPGYRSIRSMASAVKPRAGMTVNGTAAPKPANELVSQYGGWHGPWT
jgi:hypothetical protein